MQRHRVSQRVVMAIAVASFLAGSLPAQARVGSSSSSSSRSMSSFRSSAPTMAKAAPAPSRVGSGASTGMSRPNVMQQVRAPAQVAPAPARAAPAPTAPPKSSSWVAPAAVGLAVGAAAAYALSDHHTAPAAMPPQAPGYGQPGYSGNLAPYDSQHPGVSNHSNTGSQESYTAAPLSAPMADMTAGAARADSGGIGFGGMLLVLALAAAVFSGLRKILQQKSALAGTNTGTAWARPPMREEPVAMSGAEKEILGMATHMFGNLQDINNRMDRTALRTVTTPEMFALLETDFVGRVEPSRTQVVSVEPELLDDAMMEGQRVVSVRLVGLVREADQLTPENVDEVWHFIQEAHGDWKLAGIEQV